MTITHLMVIRYNNVLKKEKKISILCSNSWKIHIFATSIIN